MPGVSVVTEFIDMTRNADDVQAEVLQKILRENANTEYLKKHGIDAMTDEESFKTRLPLITHADIEEEVRRVSEGDKSAILSERPFDMFFLSSGTTKGRTKLIPMREDFFLTTLRLFQISGAFRSRVYPINPNGKVMEIAYCGKQFLTKGGLKAGTGTTNYFRSDVFTLKQETSRTYNSSPNEVIFCPQYRQAMFCHLFFGLLHRNEIQFIASTFVYSIVEILRYMEDVWECLADSFEQGTLPRWITDPAIRKAVFDRKIGGDRALASLIRAECSQGFQGIVARLWKEAKYIYSIMTGTMESYTPKMRFYAGSVPLVCGDYGASETWIAINVNPLASPESTTFTILPDLAYFEFVPVKRRSNGMTSNEKLIKSSSLFVELPPVGLSDVKIGEEYEIVITTFTGLYRYRLGDIVKITGFYNCSPQFRYVCRRDVLLSIHIDKNGERDLQMVIEKAEPVLRKSNLELKDYTTQADMHSERGHYVFFVEIKMGKSRAMSDSVLQEYCNCLDASFVEPGYVISRAARTIGPLELSVVEPGTFERVLENALDNGGTLNQYKTPRCVAAPQMLSMLKDGVIRKFFSS